MSIPTTKAIRTHLTARGVPAAKRDLWARFFTGLDWSIIKPLAGMAINAHTHPALAAGLVIRKTQNRSVAETLTAHLEAQASKGETARGDDHGAPAARG